MRRFYLPILPLMLAGCMPPYQSVPGSYPTPNKRVESMAMGATAGTMIATGAVASLPVLAGAGAGVLTTHAKTRLIDTLAKQGVNVITQGDKLRVVLSSDQFFYASTPTLNPTQYPVLTNVAALLKEYGKVPITITAYTDNIHSTHANTTLSHQQAESLRAYLWVHGIEQQHVQAVGLGERRPVAANAGKGLAANRRVEITLRAI